MNIYDFDPIRNQLNIGLLLYGMLCATISWIEDKKIFYIWTTNQILE